MPLTSPKIISHFPLHHRSGPARSLGISNPNALPPEFCSVHQTALEKLTSSFSRFTRAAHGCFTAYQDLIWWGIAEEQREPITRNGVACGEYIFIKLAK